MHHSIPVTARRLVAALIVANCACRGFAEESAPATDHPSMLAPFVNDDTFFVSYVDLASLAPPKNQGALFFVMAQAPKEVQNKLLGFMIIGGLVERYQVAGGQGLYMLMGLEDLNAVGGPVLLATAAPGKSLDGVEQLIREVIQEVSANSSQVALLPVAPLLRIRRVGNVVLVGTESVVESYATRTAASRGDLVEPLAKMSSEGAILTAVFSPGPDFRRVVRELWPAFPEPLTLWKGELADRWLRLELAAKSEPVPSAELVMQATDAESAALFVQLLNALPAASEQATELGNKRHELKRMLETLVVAVPPRIDGSRVVMSVPSDGTQLMKLQGLLGEASDAALESSRRHERVDKFKQMALGMFNYLDMHKNLFPPAAIRDSNGRPLLSWRVAILPYLEDTDAELFKQFHLDEPWDSPHNLALAKTMPQIYSDPSLPELARQGKTTYVVPVGPGTAFDTEAGTPIKGFTDGTSKTILIVDVPPDDAVIWTKPDDWQVDLDHPLRGLERSDRDYVTAAWCDGSVQLIRLDIKPELLRALLTRSGGEVVDRP